MSLSGAPCLADGPSLGNDKHHPQKRNSALPRGQPSIALSLYCIRSLFSQLSIFDKLRDCSVLSIPWNHLGQSILAIFVSFVRENGTLFFILLPLLNTFLLFILDCPYLSPPQWTSSSPRETRSPEGGQREPATWDLSKFATLVRLLSQDPWARNSCQVLFDSATNSPACQKRQYLWWKYPLLKWLVFQRQCFFLHLELTKSNLGACCAKTGNCGYGLDYCGDRITPNDVCWSNCNAFAECGKDAEVVNATCALQVCCSQYGFCGTTIDFCENVWFSNLSKFPELMIS